MLSVEEGWVFITCIVFMLGLVTGLAVGTSITTKRLTVVFDAETLSLLSKYSNGYRKQELLSLLRLIDKQQGEVEKASTMFSDFVDTYLMAQEDVEQFARMRETIAVLSKAAEVNKEENILGMPGLWVPPLVHELAAIREAENAAGKEQIEVRPRGTEYFKEMFSRGVVTVEFELTGDDQAGLESAIDIVGAMNSGKQVLPGLTVASISGFKLTQGYMLNNKLISAALSQFCESSDITNVYAIMNYIESGANPTLTKSNYSQGLAGEFIESICNDSNKAVPEDVRVAMTKVYEYMDAFKLSKLYRM